MNGPSMGSAKTIKLAERRVFSQSFKPLYHEGMGLVEQAAEYLDGKGRAEAKKLSRTAATLYAAESMRLTTRLMQVASWLLLQRARQFRRDDPRPGRVRKSPRCVSTPLRRMTKRSAGLNCRRIFCDIVTRSLRLQARVRRMDEEIYGEAPSPMRRRRFAAPIRFPTRSACLNTAFARG